MASKYKLCVLKIKKVFFNYFTQYKRIVFGLSLLNITNKLTIFEQLFSCQLKLSFMRRWRQSTLLEF